MTPEKQAELTNQLADHGLTVLLTRDFDSILIQLARLAQFERLITVDAENNCGLACVKEVNKFIQTTIADREQLRPMEILDVPTVLAVVHKALHDQLGGNARLDDDSVHAATAAFIGILCRK